MKRVFGVDVGGTTIKFSVIDEAGTILERWAISTNTSDSGPPMTTAMNIANTRCTGARTHMRRIIWKAFCTLVTSVVMRVTRPAVENLSMLEKE